MRVAEAVKARRSIRGFKPDPVPEELLREILDIARHAPSNCNTQPWHITVVSGEARNKLEDAEVHLQPQPILDDIVNALDKGGFIKSKAAKAKKSA